MFDLPLPIQPSTRPMGPAPNGPTVAPDPSLPFALTRMHRTPAALVNLHSKLTQRDHLKMTHLRGSKAHRRAAPM